MGDTLLDYAMVIAHERELEVLGHPHDTEGAIRRFNAACQRRGEPVEVPSDSAIMWEWANTPNTGDMRIDLVVFARALLARYG